MWPGSDAVADWLLSDGWYNNIIINVWFQDEYHSCEMENFHFTAVVCVVLLVLLHVRKMHLEQIPN